MSTLITDNSRFYRVKRGQTGAEIEKTLSLPAPNAFAGAIIPAGKFTVHKAEPFESYASIAKKYGVEAEELEKCNGGRPIYPSCRVFIPRP